VLAGGSQDTKISPLVAAVWRLVGGPGGDPETVRLVLAERPEPVSVAVMVVLPVVALVARPLEPAVLLIVATPLEDEDHVTDVVRSCVAPLV
jgi:hypothetical protein